LIRLLREAQPDATLTFLLGSDSLRDFPRWRDPAGIIQGARLGVVRRPGAIIDLAQVAAAVPGIVERVTFVDAPEVGISATSIRERLQAGFSIRYQVPASVAVYIAEHDLYRRYR
jgi:nicotinate-nucleotide adenylyltransferase